MPLYARHVVQYAWIVDPFSHVLEAMELKNGTWALLDSFLEEDLVAVVPFDAITIALSDLWG